MIRRRKVSLRRSPQKNITTGLPSAIAARDIEELSLKGSSKSGKRSPGSRKRTSLGPVVVLLSAKMKILYGALPRRIQVPKDADLTKIMAVRRISVSDSSANREFQLLRRPSWAAPRFGGKLWSLTAPGNRKVAARVARRPRPPQMYHRQAPAHRVKARAGAGDIAPCHVPPSLDR